MNTPVTFLRPQMDLRWAKLDCWTIDVAANLLIDQSNEIRITPKAMAVLRELMARQGSVVKRDDLLGIVWRDGFPTDDVLTHAITELRRALEKDPKNPQLIETVPRVGYRLRVSVDLLDGPPERVLALDPKSQSGEISPSHLGPREPSSAPVPIALLLVLALLFIAAITIPWIKKSTDLSDLQSSLTSDQILGVGMPDIVDLVRPITTDVGYESFPSISPNGAQIAFGAKPDDVSPSRIFVRSLHSGSAMQLTRGNAREDFYPTWSFDGAQIAYLRMLNSQECRIMVVPSLGGFEREVGNCSAGAIDFFGWTPDSRKLITTRLIESDNLALRRTTQLVYLDINSGTVENFPYEGSDIEHDVQPQYSPDGRWVAFRRGASPYSDIYLVAGNGGAVRALTRVRARIRGFDWLPDSKHILFSSDHQGRLALYLLDIETGATRPTRVYDAHFPRIANNQAMAVYHVETGSQRMVMRNLQTKNKTIAQALVPSNRSDAYPNYSPDGKRIAFVSDRAGDKQIWMYDSAQSNIIPLTDHRGSELSEPQWSNDGTRVMYILRNELGSAAFSVSALNGQSRREIPEGENVRSAAFSRDGNAVVYVSDRDGDWKLWSRNIDEAEPVLLADNGVRNLRVNAADGAVYFTRLAEQGVWRVNIDSPATPELISENVMFWNGESWRVGAGGLYYLYESENEKVSGFSLVREYRDQNNETVIEQLLKLSDTSTNQFALDPQQKSLITIETWQAGTDIYRLDLAPFAKKAP